MPSSITVSGGSVFSPGVYASVDASALGGATVAQGVIAVVSDEWKFLKKDTVTSATTAAGLQALEPGNAELKRVAKLMFGASNDPNILGAPSKVMLVTGGTNTQAVKVINGTDANGAYTVKSLAYGPVGNTTTFKVEAGTTATNGQKITISRSGVTEVYDNTADEDVFKIKYTGSTEDTSTAEVIDVTGVRRFRVQHTKIQAAPGAGSAHATYSPVDPAFDGTIKVTLSVAPGSSENRAYLITGTDKSTGLAATETVTISNTDTTATSTKEFSAVTSISATASGSAADSTATFEWYAFNKSSGDFTYVSDLLEAIAPYSKYTATELSSKNKFIPVAQLDIKASATIHSSTDVTFAADLWKLLEDLKGSALVELERDSDGADAGSNSLGTVALAGGSHTASSDSFASAFQALRDQDVQIIVPLTQTAAVHAALKTHVVYMAGKGQNECSAIVGCTKDTSKANLLSNDPSVSPVKALNSQYMSVVAQEIYVTSPAGVNEWLGPEYLALVMASLQASSDVATPLTYKRPNVLNFRQAATVDVKNDREELIAGGYMFLERDRIGIRVMRSVTSYLADANPIFSELSAMESVNTSIRDLRSFLISFIGGKNVAGTANRVKTIAKSRLLQQIEDGIIKAFDQAGLTVADNGDSFDVSVTLAPVEPINFIKINLSVDRLSE